MQITSVNSEPNIPNFQALTWNVGYSRRWPCLHRIEKRAIKRADKYESNLHKYLNKADRLSGSDNFIDILKGGLSLCRARFWRWKLHKCADWVHDWCQTNYEVGLGQVLQKEIKMRDPEYKAKVARDEAEHKRRLKNMSKSCSVPCSYFWHYD